MGAGCAHTFFRELVLTEIIGPDNTNFLKKNWLSSVNLGVIKIAGTISWTPALLGLIFTQHKSLSLVIKTENQCNEIFQYSIHIYPTKSLLAQHKVKIVILISNLNIVIISRIEYINMLCLIELSNDTEKIKNLFVALSFSPLELKEPRNYKEEQIFTKRNC